jgi:hypothetical protein
MNKKIQLHILKTLAETRERHIFILELHSILGYFGDIPQKQFIHKNSYNSEIICELDYLCEHGFVEYRKSGDVHKNLTCKITAKGLDKLEENNTVNKIKNLILPQKSIADFIWGCVAGIVMTVISQYILKFFGLLAK